MAGRIPGKNAKVQRIRIDENSLISRELANCWPSFADTGVSQTNRDAGSAFATLLRRVDRGRKLSTS
jgi:hypothetical protein